MKDEKFLAVRHSSFCVHRSSLASVAGLEPATSAFVVQHSDFQLSYTEEIVKSKGKYQK